MTFVSHLLKKLSKSGPFDIAIYALKSFDTAAALEGMKPYADQLPPISCVSPTVWTMNQPSLPCWVRKKSSLERSPPRLAAAPWVTLFSNACAGSAWPTGIRSHCSLPRALNRGRIERPSLPARR